VPIRIPETRARAALVATLIAAIALVACTSPAASPSLTPETSTPAVPSASATASESPAGEMGTIEGLFDVGGHRLFLKCEGTGSPTVIYLHGSITEPSVTPHRNGLFAQRALADEYRVCVYDRRNLGLSDTVDAVQTPDDALNDLHRLLAAAEVEPPYVLLGASFGGLLSYLYANTYPDEVVAMVQLDSPFPDEMSLEHLWPPEDRYEAFHEEDEASLERISHFSAHEDAVPFIGHEPAIPMTYFASLQEPWNGSEIPEYDAVILDVLAAYVDRFSPGTLISVDSPHFMEPEIPDQIVTALRDVIAAAGH
jgi:pimeloyl-ACP methyl ester carboxylesterase